MKQTTIFTLLIIAFASLSLHEQVFAGKSSSTSSKTKKSKLGKTKRAKDKSGSKAKLKAKKGKRSRRNGDDSIGSIFHTIVRSTGDVARERAARPTYVTRANTASEIIDGQEMPYENQETE